MPWRFSLKMSKQTSILTLTQYDPAVWKIVATPMIPHSGALQFLFRWNFLVVRPNRGRIPNRLDAGTNRHRFLSLYLFPRQRQAQNHKLGRQTPVERKTKVKSSTTVEGNSKASLVHPKQSTVKFVSLILCFQACSNCWKRSLPFAKAGFIPNKPLMLFSLIADESRSS